MDTTAPLIRALNDYQQSVDQLLARIAGLERELADAKADATTKHEAIEDALQIGGITT